MTKRIWITAMSLFVVVAAGGSATRTIAAADLCDHTSCTSSFSCGSACNICDFGSEQRGTSEAFTGTCK
jgi:hypothetical protein